jgi:ABC-type glycerol-3-phosphate transport system substrate-binding protein
MKNNKLNLLAAVLFLTLIFTSCGSRDNSYDVEMDFSRPLTILANDALEFVFNDAERAMRAALGHPEDLEIEIEFYSSSERADRMERLGVEIMAGQVADIYFLDFMPSAEETRKWAILNSGTLACFYELIDNDPRVSRDDFFATALAAWETNGSLHTIPMAMGMEFVRISSVMPQSVIDRFAAKDTISIGEMLRLYLELIENYSEFSHVSPFYPIFGHGYTTPIITLLPAINGFIDFANHTSHLNDDRFTAFLDTWRKVFEFYEIDLAVLPSVASLIERRQYPALRSERYMFSVEGSRSNQTSLVYALSAGLDPYFTHAIPVTDEQGRLVTTFTTVGRQQGDAASAFTGQWALPVISVGENTQLAWEFVKHLIPAFANHQDTLTYLSPPILREYLDSYTRRAMNQFARSSYGGFSEIYETREEQQAVLNNAVETLERVAEMPFANPHFLPRSIYFDLLNDFLMLPSDFATAEATARELHNRVTLWLIE